MKESLEKYLQTIYVLSKQTFEIKSVEVGHRLGVNRPDVFRALKTLKLCGYIEQQPYGKIILTANGKAKAEQTAKIHQAITGFFTDVLLLAKPDAEANAFKIEHILSDSAIAAILKQTQKK